ncbi:HAD family hydrolase [Roseobacter sinensis]|uniref:phosphoglycolate phosphatase n=1 Tax=Roseobacter sinensis TaxID=2931391 RepID=A0ABT3B9T3_9RHOB|nr:HAD family hydrolase [Roseobacter sp. WL0113]MCV3270337.1 HAD family hydrolase [Roseobacter sp. WL0113]
MTFPPDLVIFDCDGVLVDSEVLSVAIMRDNLARHGLDLSRAQADELFVGGTMMGIMEMAQNMGADLPDDWVELIYQDIYAELAAKVEPVDGIVDVLDALDAAGIACAVGSNGRHEKMEITLTRTGLKRRLAGRIYSRQDVARPKPAPDLYLHAAAQAGVPVSRAVVIEDSPTGAQAARAAGMLCFGYTAATDPARMTPLCDAVFDRMAVLPGLLGL